VVIDLIIKAAEENDRDRKRAQWNALLPLMNMKMVDYEPFETYYERVTGKNYDARPSEEILAEVAEIRKELEG